MPWSAHSLVRGAQFFFPILMPLLIAFTMALITLVWLNLLSTLHVILLDHFTTIYPSKFLLQCISSRCISLSNRILHNSRANPSSRWSKTTQVQYVPAGPVQQQQQMPIGNQQMVANVEPTQQFNNQNRGGRGQGFQNNNRGQTNQQNQSANNVSCFYLWENRAF